MKIHSLAESKHSDLYLKRSTHCPLCAIKSDKRRRHSRSDYVNSDESCLLLLFATETESFVFASILALLLFLLSSACKCDEMKVDRQVSAAGGP